MNFRTMSDSNTISFRISKIIDDVFQGNKSEFARIVTIGESNVRSYLNGTLPKADVLEKIATNVAISCEWLLTGRGEMLEKNFQENDSPKMTAQNDSPKPNLDSPKRQPKIEQNSKYDTSTEKNFQQFDTPKLTRQNDTPKPDFDTPKRHTKTEIAAHDGAIQRNYHGATYVEAGGIPLIPIEAAAGILSGDNVQVMDYECDHYVIPAFHGADFLIRVAGDSMTPRYMSGDLVACIRLAMVDFLQWNKSYIIDSAQGVLLKRVKRSQKPDHLLLISENEEYDPFEIPTSEIRGLALVVGLIRIE